MQQQKQKTIPIIVYRTALVNVYDVRKNTQQYFALALVLQLMAIVDVWSGPLICKMDARFANKLMYGDVHANANANATVSL